MWSEQEQQETGAGITCVGPNMPRPRGPQGLRPAEMPLGKTEVSDLIYTLGLAC